MRSTAALAAFATLASAASLLGLDVDLGLGADVEIASVAQAKVGVEADASVDLSAARSQYAGYKCPGSMSYCPWTKSCACPPGQNLDLVTKTCVGNVRTGAWPEPDISVYGTVNVKLATFCAASPTKIVKYDPNHKYCQASLNTVTFCAAAAIELEVAAQVEIDIQAKISADLKNVCAALHGLYLESVVDAAIAFNTDVLGLATVTADLQASLSVGLLNTFKGLGCKLGLGKCTHDCVAYCAKGCKNYIDVGVGVGVEAGAEVGATINGLVGFCILPKVILIVNAATKVVAHAVDGLLCLVGGLIKTILSTFDCHCH